MTSRLGNDWKPYYTITQVLNHVIPTIKPKDLFMNNAEVRQKVVDKLLPRIEKEGLAWSMPWTARHVAGSPFKPLRSNGQPYNGINRMHTGNGYSACKACLQASATQTKASPAYL